MHVGSACNTHVLCMLYECWSNKHVGSACIMIFIYQIDPMYLNVAVLFISEYPLYCFILENLFQ